ncbi:hypothetical protein BDR04DRAFT_1119710 [Suillus decipiens]|nr:hypothetical protein BDR04DRAFT_1119710 [Suillus decipiens]
MSHAQTPSDISDLSNLSDLSVTLNKPESVISFNEDVYLAMQNTAVSTATYMGQAQKIIEQLSTNQYRWIITPPNVHNMDTSRVLDAILRNTQQTSGESSEHYTTCAICACPDIHEQVNLTRTWFMYLLWPFTAGTHQPSNLISDQAMPTIDDTYGSLAHTAAATWNIMWHYSGMSKETI